MADDIDEDRPLQLTKPGNRPSEKTEGLSTNEAQRLIARYLRVKMNAEDANDLAYQILDASWPRKKLPVARRSVDGA